MNQLSKLYGAIQQQLEANVASTGAQVPSFGIGNRDAFEERAAPPHISWMPIGGTIGPPKDAGGDQTSDPRPLFSRQFQTMAYVWANGMDAANELMQHLVAAAYAVSHGKFKPVREDWVVSGDRDAGNIVALTFSVGLPFVDETAPTVTLGSAPITGNLVHSGGS